MKVIIAGGRRYYFSIDDFKEIYDLHKTHKFSEVVSGGSKGADFEGECWAATNGLPKKRFVANWKEEGRAAGPIRNRKMAQYADALIALPGGAGTKNMISEAKKAGLKIFLVGDHS